jgi:hypothetical protein
MHYYNPQYDQLEGSHCSCCVVISHYGSVHSSAVSPSNCLVQHTLSRPQCFGQSGWEQ